MHKKRSAQKIPSFNGIWKFANILITGPYFESAESSLHHPTPFLKTKINIILPSKSRTSKWSFSFRFSDNCFQISYSFMRFACSSHLTLLDLVILYYSQKITNYVPVFLRTGGTVVVENKTQCGLVSKYRNFTVLLAPQVSPQILICEST